MNVEGLINEIKNGVLTKKGDMRKFDIIDYYMYVNGYSEEQMLSKLSSEELKIVKEFLEKNTNSKQRILLDITLRNLCSIDYEYGLKTDDKGMPIAGTGKKISTEEMTDIVEFLKEIKVPITKDVINLAIEKYKKKELNVKKNKARSK